MKAEMPKYQNAPTSQLPRNWRLLKLSDVAEINPGRTKPKSGNDEVSFLAMGDVSEDGQVICRQTRSYQDVAKGFTSFVENDVLVAKITPCFENGKGALATNLLSGIGFGSTEFHVIRANEEHALPSFLHLHTRYDSFRRSGERNMVGSAGQKRVPTDFLRDYKIALPPIQEQKKIAAILATVDDKLDVIARQIEASLTLKRGLMQTLFSQGAGTRDADGQWVPHAEFKESELGVIPKMWTVAEIISIADVIRGASPRPQGDPRYYGGNIPRLMGTDVTRDGKWVTPKIDFLTQEGAKRSRPCLKGTLTIICSGDVGVPSFLAVDACIHDGFLALINIDESRANKNFLYHIIFSLKQKLDASATHGGVFTNLTTEILKKFLLPLPPLDEQIRIASVLDTADEKLAIEKKKKAYYQDIKRGLMQKLLTGEWRVKLEDAEPVTA